MTDRLTDEQQLISHEEAHRAVVEVNSYPKSTARNAAARVAMRYVQQQERETNRLERELARAGWGRWSRLGAEWVRGSRWGA